MDFELLDSAIRDYKPLYTLKYGDMILLGNGEIATRLDVFYFYPEYIMLYLRNSNLKVLVHSHILVRYLSISSIEAVDNSLLAKGTQG